MNRDEIKERLKEIDREIRPIINYLTGAMISYSHPYPPTARLLKALERNNPKGFRGLTRYVELNEEEKALRLKLKEM